jgi:hypothetical protein
MLELGIRLGRTRPTRAFYLWLVGITIIAGCFRLYHLGTASFWFDELFTVRACAKYGATPPLYKTKVLGYMPTSLGLWAQNISPTAIPSLEPETWRSLGITEVPVRLASVSLGILTIPILGLASCRIIGTRAASFLALLLAIAPWHIYWSQAARFYTLQFLLYNLSLCWYYTATRRASRPHMIGSMLFMVLAFLAQPPALVIVGIFACDWVAGLIRKKPVRLGMFGWVCGIAALALCGMSLTANVVEAPAKWTQFVGHLYQTPTRLILGTVYMVGPGVAVFSLVTGWWLFASHRRLAIYLLLAAAAPTLVYACVSLRSYVGLRYTFVCLYAWLALAAIGSDQLYQVLRPRVGRLIAMSPLGWMLIAMMVMNHAYFTSGVGFHPRWREAYAYVANHRQPGDAVCGFPLMGRYYLEDRDVKFVPVDAEQLQAFDRPVWVVVNTNEEEMRSRLRWLDDLAELKAYFDLRVVQPSVSVRVYRYEP